MRSVAGISGAQESSFPLPSTRGFFQISREALYGQECGFGAIPRRTWQFAVAVGDHSQNDMGMAFFSIKYVADEIMRCSRRTVERASADAQKRGLIVSVKWGHLRRYNLWKVTPAFEQFSINGGKLPTKMAGPYIEQDSKKNLNKSLRRACGNVENRQESDNVSDEKTTSSPDKAITRSEIQSIPKGNGIGGATVPSVSEAPQYADRSQSLRNPAPELRRSRTGKGRNGRNLRYRTNRSGNRVPGKQAQTRRNPIGANGGNSEASADDGSGAAEQLEADFQRSLEQKKDYQERLPIKTPTRQQILRFDRSTKDKHLQNLGIDLKQDRRFGMSLPITRLKDPPPT